MIEHGHPMISHSTQSHSLSLEAVRRLSPVDLLVLSAWCGLVGGELDVAARIINRSLSSTPRLYLVTRHFVWVVPLVNLTLFLTLSVLLALTMRLFPIKFGWLCPRLIITLACFPVLMTADPNIYLEAWLLVAMGLALRVTPWLERSPSQWRRWLVRTTPFLVGLVVFQAGWLLSSDWLTQWREDARERPPKGSPNVLLIVLDTVRADHLGLFGYSRPTSPNLERLARRGIVFSQARAAAPGRSPRTRPSSPVDGRMNSGSSGRARCGGMFRRLPSTWGLLVMQRRDSPAIPFTARTTRALIADSLASRTTFLTV